MVNAKTLRKHRERATFTRSLLLLRAGLCGSNSLKKGRAGVHTAEVEKCYHDKKYRDICVLSF
jgi:hypothetical protein